jgi:hypothetical protein
MKILKTLAATAVVGLALAPAAVAGSHRHDCGAHHGDTAHHSHLPGAHHPGPHLHHHSGDGR